MVRTKADPAGVKASGGKAPRKASLTSSGGRSGKGDSKAKQYTSGNSYCPRETPSWQKEITKFFTPKPAGEAEGQESSSTSSKSSPQESDEVEEIDSD